MKDSKNLEFMHGKGKRKSSLWKSIETLKEYKEIKRGIKGYDYRFLAHEFLVV